MPHNIAVGNSGPMNKGVVGGSAFSSSWCWCLALHESLDKAGLCLMLPGCAALAPLETLKFQGTVTRCHGIELVACIKSHCGEVGLSKGKLPLVDMHLAAQLTVPNSLLGIVHYS